MSLEQEFLKDKNLGMYDRPEDELETPEKVRLLQRERAFSAEGGFRDLLTIKVFLSDIADLRGFLTNSIGVSGLISMMNEPFIYAQELFDKKSDIESENVKTKEAFQEKKFIEIIADIDRYIEVAIKYITINGSETFKIVKQMLEECKEAAIHKDLMDFSIKATKMAMYFKATDDLVTLCCGMDKESGETRKLLGLEVNKYSKLL